WKRLTGPIHALPTCVALAARLRYERSVQEIRLSVRFATQRLLPMLARRLRIVWRKLTRFQIEVWLDRNRITAGARWQTAIRDAIREEAFFLACFRISFQIRLVHPLHGPCLINVV